MANRQEELVYAMEELTGTMKRQGSLTETMGQAIQGAMMSTENLKAAMLKTGRFSEGKMLGAIEKMSDMPGRIDKVIQGFGQYLQQGLGSHTDKFIGVVSKISALGLDNGPFLQLARSMNSKMGMSIDQRDQHFKELLNLREVTGQNPELMAKALAQQSQTFSEAAGIWGPGFSEKLMNSMKVMAVGNGGDAMVGQMMTMMKPLLEAGPEGEAKRAMLNQGRGPGLSADMSQSDMIEFIKTSMKSMGDNPAFGTALTRKITGGGVLGMGGSEFQTASNMTERLAGTSTSDLMDMIEQIKVGGGDGTVGEGAGNSQSEDQLMSVKLNNVINQFADVLPEAITKVGNALDGLAGSAAGLAGWVSGMLKGFANDGADLLADGIGGAKKLGGKIGAPGSTDLTGTAGALAGAVGSLATETGKGLAKFFTDGNGLERIFDTVVLFFKEWAHKLPRLLGDVVSNLGNMLKYTFNWVKDFLTLFATNLMFDLQTLQMKFMSGFKLTMDLLMSHIAQFGDFWDDIDYEADRERMKEDSAAGTGEYKGMSTRVAANRQAMEKDSMGEFNMPEWVATDASEKEEDIAMAREQVRLLAYFKNAFDGDTMRGDLSEMKTEMSKIWKWLDEKATNAL